jgi:hypothetical protein
VTVVCQVSPLETFDLRGPQIAADNDRSLYSGGTFVTMPPWGSDDATFSWGRVLRWA